MTPQFGRRAVLLGGAGALAAAAAAIPTNSFAATGSGLAKAPASISNEQHQLAVLYRAALAEGGKLTVYAGGDTPTQQDQARYGFLAQFPKMDLNMVVDLSKVQDARVDAQLSSGRVIADVVELQTLDDFPRWKREGALRQYKPLAFEKVRPQFKDEDGYYTGVVVLAFANVTSTSLGSAAPVEASDFLKPEFKGKLIFTYPNDDDAVLFFFRQLVEKYGWGYLEKLMAQNPTFVRGTAASAGAVYGGYAEATFATFSGLQSAPTDPARFTLPVHSPFVSWAQTAAILKKSPHPAAAKLYISWLLSTPVQSSGATWSPRADIPVPPGYRSIFAYPNTDPTALRRFLSDRESLDRFKARIQLYVGDVTGPSPTGVLGFYPGAF